MSEKSNKALIDRYSHVSMVERNLGALDQFFPGEFIDHTMPDGKSNPDMIRHSLQQYFEAFPDFSAVVEDTVAENDLVVTRLKLSGTHEGSFYGAPGTGKKFTVGAMQVYRIANDKIVERWFWVDALGMRQQLGLQ